MEGAMNETTREVSWRRRIPGMAAFLALVGTACGGDVGRTGPTYAYLNVKVTAAGGDLDLNGCSVLVDDQRQPVADGGVASFVVSSGPHQVSLGDVAPNCSVVGDNPRSVSVEPVATVQVLFQVECVLTGVAITTRTTGVDLPDTYRVSVD